MFLIPPRKLGWVPVGADERVFRADVERGASSVERADVASERSTHHAPRSTFLVLQYAEFTPLHGGEHVLDAARRLQDIGAPIDFELIGDGGPLFEELQRRAEALQLTNVTFRGYMPEKELVARVHAADLCLGVFGDGAKAQRVIPNKVYQCLAAAKPVLTGDTRAMRRVFENDRDLALCPVADGEALAAAIERLRDDPALLALLAHAGHARFRAQFSFDAIAEQIECELQAALNSTADPAEEPVEATNIA